MTSLANSSRAADLLLIRLLAVGKTKLKPKTLRSDLEKLGASPGDDFDDLVKHVRQAGWVEPSELALTDQGRGHALSLLGVGELPARLTWAKLRDQYVMSMAAGPDSGDVSTKGRLANFMLKRKYGLRVPAGATSAKIIAALTFHELGFPQVSTIKQLQEAVISRMIASPTVLPLSRATEQLVRLKLGAPHGKPDELRRALIEQWLRGDAPTTDHSAAPEATPLAPAPAGASDGTVEDAERANESTPPPLDLPTFATAAERAARQSESGWFGDNKVFISHAWRQFNGIHPRSEMDLGRFKHRLIEANREGLLKLSRADLVAAMDPRDVRESEARYLNTEFHFILIEGKAS